MHVPWTIAALAMLAVSALLVLIGFRGRRVNEHPLCRRCGFDAYGKPAGTAVWSAGGAMLSHRRGPCGSDTRPLGGGRDAELAELTRRLGSGELSGGLTGRRQTGLPHRTDAAAPRPPALGDWMGEGPAAAAGEPDRRRAGHRSRVSRRPCLVI